MSYVNLKELTLRIPNSSFVFSLPELIALAAFDLLTGLNSQQLPAALLSPSTVVAQSFY